MWYFLTDIFESDTEYWGRSSAGEERTAEIREVCLEAVEIFLIIGKGVLGKKKCYHWWIRRESETSKYLASWIDYFVVILAEELVYFIKGDEVEEGKLKFCSWLYTFV